MTAISSNLYCSEQERCRMEPYLYCGTTAIGAFIHGRTLTVFNIGDCRAVLCRHGEAVI